MQHSLLLLLLYQGGQGRTEREIQGKALPVEELPTPFVASELLLFKAKISCFG